MKRLNRMTYLVCGVVAGMGVALAQSSNTHTHRPVSRAGARLKNAATGGRPVPGELYQSGTVDLSLNGPGVVAGGVECDSDGNIYMLSAPTVRVVALMAPTGLNLPVTKIDVGSGNEVQYPLGPFSGYRGFYQHDFYVTPGGTVYRLVSAYRPKESDHPGDWPDNLVVRYKRDGTVASVTVLQSPQGTHLDAYKLAVFSDGNLLVVGALIAGKRHLPASPFSGIFDSSGDYLGSIRMPGGAGPSNTPSARTSPGSVREAPPRRPDSAPWNMAIRQGVMVGSPSGTVYLIETSRPAHLFVISSIGKVLAHLTIRPPAPDMEPTQASVNGQGQLLVEFAASPWKGESPSAILALVDPATGEVLESLRPPFDAGIPACVTMQDEFVFLGSDKAGNLLIRKFLAR